MKKRSAKLIYFVFSLALISVGVIMKCFLSDTDLGARFYNFNHRLLSSDLIFLCALLFGIIGSIFYSIGKNQRSALKDATVIKSAALIVPLIILLILMPVLQTFYPGEVGDNPFVPVVSGLSVIAVFSTFAWFILLVIIFIKQIIIILANRNKQ